MDDLELVLETYPQWKQGITLAAEHMKKPESFGHAPPTLLMLDEQNQLHVLDQLAKHFRLVAERHLAVEKGLGQLAAILTPQFRS